MIKLQLLKISMSTLLVLITCKYFQIVMMVSFKFDQYQIFNVSSMVIHWKSKQDHVMPISTLCAYIKT